MSTSSSSKNTGSRAGNTGQAQQRSSRSKSQQEVQQRYRQIQEDKVRTAIKISDAKKKVSLDRHLLYDNERTLSSLNPLIFRQRTESTPKITHYG
jgi:hypothetical protein